MFYKNPEDFLDSSLALINQELVEMGTTINVVLIGGAAMILGGNVSHKLTFDIDALENKASKLLYKYGISQYDEYYLTLLPDYKDRLVPITRITFSNIKLFSLGMVDLFLTKINAGRNKDKEDCRMLIQEGAVSVSEVDRYYRIWKNKYYPDSSEIHNFYMDIINSTS